MSETKPREITDHIINPCNDKLRITTADQPGAGGANHLYMVKGFNPDTNDSLKGFKDTFLTPRALIMFQNGPIPEKGTNGLTHEALLAIVADRLRPFQAGPYSCRENALALTKIEEAMHWLNQRTLARMRRGVEGTMAK